MALPASDNFNRANANPIGGNWTTHFGTGFKLESNKIVPATYSQAVSFWNADAFQNNQYSQAILPDAARYNGVAVRCSASSGKSCYLLRFTTGTTCQLFSVTDNGGNWTQIGSNIAGVPYDASQYLRLEVEGTSLTCKFNGTTYGGVRSDATLTSGSAGVYGLDNFQSYLDNWSGGNLAAAGPAIPVFMNHFGRLRR